MEDEDEGDKQSTTGICGILQPRDSANASLTLLLASKRRRLQCISAKSIGGRRGSRDCVESAPRLGQAHCEMEDGGVRGVCIDCGASGISVWVAELLRIWLFASSIGLDTAGAGCGLCRHTRSPVARLAHHTPWLLHGAGNSYVVDAFFLFVHAADRRQWLAEPGIAGLVPCFVWGSRTRALPVPHSSEGSL